MLPNVYAVNKKASKCFKQKTILLQGEIDKCTITIKYINSPIPIFNRTHWEKLKIWKNLSNTKTIQSKKKLI